MKALWRGEVVTVVSVKNGKVQIARACGLRWVRSDELDPLRRICSERGADDDRTREALQED
jgi:hypothetical protein